MSHTDNDEIQYLRKVLEELSADFTTLESVMKEILEVCETDFKRTHEIGKIERLASSALKKVSMDDEFEQARQSI